MGTEESSHDRSWPWFGSFKVDRELQILLWFSPHFTLQYLYDLLDPHWHNANLDNAIELAKWCKDAETRPLLPASWDCFLNAILIATIFISNSGELPEQYGWQLSPSPAWTRGVKSELPRIRTIKMAVFVFFHDKLIDGKTTRTHGESLEWACNLGGFKLP